MAMGMVAAMVKVPQGEPIKALTTTSAITNHANIALVFNHFGCGAAGNQAMKARNSPASNGYKQKWEQIARKNRTGAIHKFCYGCHLNVGVDDDNGNSQAHNGADF